MARDSCSLRGTYSHTTVLKTRGAVRMPQTSMLSGDTRGAMQAYAGPGRWAHPRRWRARLPGPEPDLTMRTKQVPEPHRVFPSFSHPIRETIRTPTTITMHILVVNDDGPPSPHSSPYVHSLVRALQAAGHVVSVCLPDTQRSWIGKAPHGGPDSQAHVLSPAAADAGRRPASAVSTTDDPLSTRHAARGGRGT